MVKRRERKITEEQVDAFANEADSSSPLKAIVVRAEDTKAPRNFKSVKFGMNEYEYRLLKMAADKSGRSMLGFIRWAAISAAKEVPN